VNAPRATRSTIGLTSARLTFLALGLFAWSSGVPADESTLRLVPGPQLATLEANCSGCHSLDYVQMNSRFLGRAGWEAEIKKMVGVMGAPVSAADQQALLDYLVREYGVAD